MPGNSSQPKRMNRFCSPLCTFANVIRAQRCVGCILRSRKATEDRHCCFECNLKYWPQRTCCNVRTCTGCSSARRAPASAPIPALTSTEQAVPQTARTLVLQRLNTTILPQHLPSLQISATAYVGGHIAGVASEHMDCENCIAFVHEASEQPPDPSSRGGLERRPLHVGSNSLCSGRVRSFC